MVRWERQIEIKQLLDVDEYDPEQVILARDQVVVVLKRQPEYDNDDEYTVIVDELVDVDSNDWFDAVLEALYDWADDHRIWIGGDASSTLPSIGASS